MRGTTPDKAPHINHIPPPTEAQASATDHHDDNGPKRAIYAPHLLQLYQYVPQALNVVYTGKNKRDRLIDELKGPWRPSPKVLLDKLEYMEDFCEIRLLSLLYMMAQLLVSSSPSFLRNDIPEAGPAAATHAGTTDPRRRISSKHGKPKYHVPL